MFSKEIPRTQSLGFLCAGTHHRREMSEESPVPRRVSVKSQARGDENSILKTQREKIGHLQRCRHQSGSGFSAEVLGAGKQQPRPSRAGTQWISTPAQSSRAGAGAASLESVTGTVLPASGAEGPLPAPGAPSSRGCR